MDIEKINKELDELFVLANNELKLAEFTGEKAIISPLNEFRNGTEHRVKASIASDEQSKINELNKAKQHYVRAAYDALQSRILFSLDKLQEFREYFYKAGDKDNIPDLIEIINLSNDLRENLFKSRKENYQYSDFIELQKKATLFDSKLNSFSTNKALVFEKVKKSNRKVKNVLLSSVLALVTTVIAGILTTFILVDKPKDKEISAQITELSNIQSSLKNLQDYVINQKETLETLNSDISALNSRKKQLESILAIDKDEVDVVLKELEGQNRNNRWIDLVISFLIGVFSSTTVALIFWYIDRKSKQPSLNSIITTKGVSIINTNK